MNYVKNQIKNCSFLWLQGAVVGLIQSVVFNRGKYLFQEFIAHSYQACFPVFAYPINVMRNSMDRLTIVVFFLLILFQGLNAQRKLDPIMAIKQGADSLWILSH